jgi:hypothetical protein
MTTNYDTNVLKGAHNATNDNATGNRNIGMIIVMILLFPISCTGSCRCMRE